MISADLLRRLRNDLPMSATLAALGRQGPPSKMSEGYLRFLCPGCSEMLAVLSPALIAFLSECCRIVIASRDVYYTDNSANSHFPVR